MAILQTDIDTLTLKLEKAKCDLSYKYSISGLNGIRNYSLEAPIIELQVMIDELDNYNLEDYEDSYYHSIRSNSIIYCGNTGVTNDAVSSTQEDDFNIHKRFLVTVANAGATDTVDSGFSLPSRSRFAFVQVILLGYRSLTIGDGNKNAECYFSSDGGTIVKTIASLKTGDVLYLNSVEIGAPISVIDQVEISIL